MTLHDLGSYFRMAMGRKRFVLAVDIACALVAEALLLIVVLNGRDVWPVVTLLAVTVVASAGAMFIFRTYRQLWSRVTLNDVVDLAKAAFVVALATAIASYWDFGPHAPIRVGTGSFFVLMAGWAGPRILARLWWESQASTKQKSDKRELEPILLLGSDRRAGMFIKSNALDPRYDILGFFHADPRMKGRLVSGVPGLGPIEDLGEELRRLALLGLAPKRLVVTNDDARDGSLAIGLDHAARHGLILCRLPDAVRLVSGNESVQQVTIEDILHRDTVSLNRPEVPEVLRGSRILVTGAGGSIGSELVRQIAAYDPGAVILVENCEYNLYAIERELGESFPHVERHSALADVRDRDCIDRVFRDHRPDIVLHAAALKHVPLLEQHPDQAVLTNVMGTRNVAGLALEHGIAQFTLVSTDKAVNPTNAMGATKRWAEMICQSFDSEAERRGVRTRYACVRFGNVLGSAGSVVPLFRQQIAKGGPITVTDPAITRYFMTIPEACELILTATATTSSNEQREPRVFVLDMGEPVRIVSLAERMIQLHGMRPYEDIGIEFTGLRPGEKLYEELAHPDENLVPASFARASLADARTPAFAVVSAAVDRVVAIAARGDIEAVLVELARLVPEYRANLPLPGKAA
jgi:FlaA1/EpsC-like NDP-sugar epimerase